MNWNTYGFLIFYYILWCTIRVIWKLTGGVAYVSRSNESLVFWRVQALTITSIKYSFFFHITNDTPLVACSLSVYVFHHHHTIGRKSHPPKKGSICSEAVSFDVTGCIQTANGNFGWVTFISAEWWQWKYTYIFQICLWGLLCWFHW